MDREGVAQMEHRLLAESELSDGRVVGRLDALAERQDAFPIFRTEFAVVDDQQTRSLNSPWWNPRVAPRAVRRPADKA